mmetsp:Transcript_31338/g.76779  ORF Transcript_31338/g.76779 Transcript_31338/m.76779 type:complete len:316 (-) Transcript_31338:44-991(-)
MSKREKKELYFERVSSLLQEYDKILFVQADNVGSNQLQRIRAAIREDSVILMGKNTLIKKVLGAAKEENPKLEPVSDLILGNVGLVFTKGDLNQVRDTIAANKVPAAARAGTFAQCDVFIPPGPTGMEPTMTSFFQALNIPTKINKGQIEIQAEVKLLEEGQKVGSSEVALLQKLGIRPFSYGLKFQEIYDNGAIYSSKVLDITDDDLTEKIKEGITNLTAVALGADYPIESSVPHSLINGFKNVMYASLGTEYTIPQLEELKKILDDPEALAAMASAAATSGGGGAAAAEDAAPEAAQEEEEEEDEDMGFSLFD